MTRRTSSRMLSLLAAACAGPIAPGDEAARFVFEDVTEWRGRPTGTYTMLRLQHSPPRLPEQDSDREIPAEARWGLLRVGETADDALLCAVAPRGEGGLAAWIDCDGDGALQPRERRMITGGLAEFPVVVRRVAAPPLTRTAILRRSKLGDGLQYVVRGACVGEVEAGGERYAALLTDCSGDGLFHSPAADRIMIDLDRDARFDGVTEQFPLGRPFRIGGETVFAAADAAGERVWIRPRSAERGRLRVRLFDGARDVVQVSAALVSELGEAELIERLDEPVELPTGRYRVSSLALELRESERWKWIYLFDGARGAAVEVRAGEEAALTLLEELSVNVELRREGSQAGGLLAVTPSLGTPSGLTLVHCERQNLHEAYMREWRAADIHMIGPDGRRATLATSGFA